MAVSFAFLNSFSDGRVVPRVLRWIRVGCRHRFPCILVGNPCRISDHCLEMSLRDVDRDYGHVVLEGASYSLGFLEGYNIIQHNQKALSQ